MTTMTLKTLTVRMLALMAQQATAPDGKSLLLNAAEENLAVIREQAPEKVADAEQWLAVIRNKDSQSTAVAEALDKILSAS